MEVNKKIKAIIVDDEELIRVLLKNALKGSNCDLAAECDNGKQVMEAVAQCQPDIVFLDIDMPEKDGLTVLKELKHDNQAQFIAMVSSNGTFENIKKSKELGANAFVTKPFAQAKIKEVIDKFRREVNAV